MPRLLEQSVKRYETVAAWLAGSGRLRRTARYCCGINSYCCGTTSKCSFWGLAASRILSSASMTFFVCSASWSFNSGGRRGSQKLTIYGSNAEADPGWDLNQWTKLGSIDTSSAAKADFTAASLRAKDGKPLGSFRWIGWSLLPVTDAGGGENTSFQELAVEVGQEKSAP